MPADPVRLVLLGASNLTMGLPTVVDLARRELLGGPVEVLAAAGHGRSYGMTSRVLHRGLPSILDCRLWRELAARPARPARVLVTDVGNDLVYGASPETAAGWVEACLERLAGVTERLAVTLLPEEALAELPRWRFRLVRALLFPARSLGLEEGRRSAADLNRRLRRLAERFGGTAVMPCRSWYGFDAIHLRRAARRTAWRTILGAWDGRGEAGGEPAAGPGRRAPRLRQGFERCTLFGIEHRRAQPCSKLADGSTLSLF